jgi:DNA-binding helix-hairpin-helix protein with protein kinase domain
MAAPSLQGASGRVVLGRELGRGGEGAVFEIAGRPDLVAKIYHSPPQQAKAQKLLAMVQMGTPQVLSLTAWPRDVLRGSDGKVHGLVMPKVTGYKDIHALYGPKSRRAEFPDADWRHLLRAATNVARAFAVLHDIDCVVGDVNHGGIRVSADMTVKLIDCDSFQVKAGGSVHLCEVGVENFTPPELQGRSFRGVLRSPNHDNFGLAVMVFYLLMLGRHPFAGRYRAQGEMPIEKAIAEHRYAYGRNANTSLMDPPPFAPRALVASSAVADLWERAFSAHGTQHAGRPSAREWVSCLSSLEGTAKRCPEHAGHYFLTAAGTCPWCAIESATGALLFLVPLSAIGLQTSFNLTAVWSRISQVAPLTPPPEISVPTAKASSEATELYESQRNRKVGGRVATVLGFLIALGVVPGAVFLWVLIGLGLWFVVGSWAKREEDVNRFRKKLAEARSALTHLQGRLSAEAGSQRFEENFKALENKRTTLLHLPTIRSRRMQALIADREKHARQRFLESFEIENAKIAGIGPAKRAMLESYNIETAADIRRAAVLDVPGFGPALATRLEDWRRSVEQKFRFDPAAGIDPRDVQNLDRSIAQERALLERALTQGPGELSQIRQEIMARREAILRHAATIASAFAQAVADWETVSK